MSIILKSILNSLNKSKNYTPSVIAAHVLKKVTSDYDFCAFIKLSRELFRIIDLFLTQNVFVVKQRVFSCAIVICSATVDGCVEIIHQCFKYQLR